MIPKLSKPVMLHLEREVVNTFSFTNEQRIAFLGSDDYLTIILLAHENNWASVEVKMNENNYFMS